MLRYLLRGEGVVIGRETVRTMMRRMCIEALYHRPNTLSRVQDTWFIRILLRGAPVDGRTRLVTPHAADTRPPCSG